MDTLSQIVRATRDEAEEALAHPTTAQPTQAYTNGRAEEKRSLENWEQIRTSWRNVRERIELKIEGIRSGRVRRKYSKLPRRSYKGVIEALRKDGEIEPNPYTALLDMNSMFQKVKWRPDRVTDEEVKEFDYLLRRIDGELPPLSPDQAELPLQPEPPRTPAREMAATAA